MLAYADDVVITARSVGRLRETFLEFAEVAERRGLCVNEGKSQYLQATRGNEDGEERLVIGDYNFDRCREFKYLGMKVVDDGGIGAEVKARIAAGNKCLFSLDGVMKSRSNVSRETKIRIYKTVLRPVVLYGSETWAVTRECEEWLRIWERKVLRRIFGPVCENGIWRRRSNEELRNLYGQPDIVTEQKKARLKWFGHVERMEESRFPKKALRGHPGGSRSRGRPRLRWEDEVMKDVRSVGVQDWRGLVEDRDRWRGMVEQALAL